MRLLFLFLFLFTNLQTFGQAPTIIWQKCYGGTLEDVGYSSLDLKNGTYMILGSTLSFDGDVIGNHQSGEDVWCILIDSLGNIVHSNCYGGSDGEEGRSILKDLDGSFVIGATANSNNGDVSGLHMPIPMSGGSNDYWLLKVDSSGTIIWQKCFGSNEDDFLTEIIQTSDSGYLLTGTTYSTHNNNGDVINYNGGGSDCWIVKTDKNGVKQWTKALGGTLYDFGYSGKQIGNNFIISAEAGSNDGLISGLHDTINGDDDAWVVKLNAMGQIIWQKCYGGSSLDYGRTILTAPNGSFYETSEADSYDGDVTGNHGSGDYWVLKADSNGNILWNSCFGGNSLEDLWTASTTHDGGILLAGVAEMDDGMVAGTHGFNDIWVVKLDSSGNFEWGKALGGTGLDIPYSVIQLQNSEYLVTGSTTSTDGDVTYNHGQKDVWVVKLSSQVNGIPTPENQLTDFTSFQNFDQLILRFFSKHSGTSQIILSNTLGKIILETDITFREGINYASINLPGLAEGMYFINATGKGIGKGKVFIK